MMMMLSLSAKKKKVKCIMYKFLILSVLVIVS